ncbi:MAG: hypothetical protein AB8B51_08800 [Sedimentitalea sp.]
MAAYMIASLLSGFVSLAYGTVFAGAGFWGAVAWYVVGTWIGFTVMLALVLLLTSLRRPAQQQLRLA